MALTDQLLSHFKEKFGIVTVVNATFYDVNGAVPKISFDTLKMSNITSEGQQKEIRGGQGADLLLQYDFGRTASIEITDALVSVGSLEYLFGGKQSAGIKTFPRRIEGTLDNGAYPQGFATTIKYTANKPSKIILISPTGVKTEIDGATALPTLPSGTEAGTKFILFYQETRVVGTNKTFAGVITSGDFETGKGATEPGDYIDDTDVTVTVTDVSTGNVTTFVKNNDWPVIADIANIANGDTYTIHYKSTENDGSFGFKEMVLTAADFPPIVRMIGETVVVDIDTGKRIALQIEIPKLKLNANFTLNFDAEGDPSVFDFGGVALAQNGDLIKIRTLGEVPLYN
jgi:hypothetical protein